MSMETAVAGAPGYPLRFEIEYPERLSRWMIFVKWLLAIPHIIVLLFLYIIALVVWVIVWFAILFTGRFPRGLFDFLVGVNRWYLRGYAYAALLLGDDSPPFSLR